MAGNTRENGLIITWKVWESTHGLMAVDMKVNTKMTRNTVMVFIFGQIDVNTKACGTKVNNTG